LVVFIGAGFSRLAGSPSWEGFADSALQFLARKGILFESELDQLRRLPSPRRRLSIAIDMAKVRDLQIPYTEILHPADRGAGIQEDDNYRILFIGYGLEELELLEFIINKGRAPETKSEEGKQCCKYAD